MQDSPIGQIDHDINELSDKLDKKFGKSWNIWRSITGHWCFRGTLKEQQCEARGDGIASAMMSALCWEAIPLVPPEVRTLMLDAFEPVKVGSSAWRLIYDGNDCCVRFKTKREAMEYAEERTEQSKLDRDKWLDKFGWTLHMTEGKDYRTSQHMTLED